MPWDHPSIEERVARYDAWRLRRKADRPMIGLLWEPDISPPNEFLSSVEGGGEISAQQIEPEHFLACAERWHEQESGLIHDGIQRFTPAFGIPWMEAIAGCPVVAKPGSLWAQPCLDSLTNRRPIRFDAENPWTAKLLDFTRVLARRAAGRFPVAAPQLRGPLDTMAAMRTPEQMCLDLVEQPEESAALLGELASLWISVGRAVLDQIPPFHGGCMGRMGGWFPDKAITPQNDVSTLISPQQYRRFALPHDARIVAAFPYTEFHMHASEHHQADNLIQLAKLTAIEFTLEHTLGGPPLAKMLPVVRRVLRAKPVILAALDVETADRCLTQLPHEGLFLALAVSGCDVPSDVARWLETRCR
jgi:hypothetical protein